MEVDCDFSSPGCVLNLTKCSKKEILDVFLRTYNVYEGLFSAITKEKYFYSAPDRLRLPLIFYLGHTATLYINKMVLGGMIKERVNYEFEKLFETGVDEMSWDDTENYRMGGAFKWPSVKEVMEYRNKVKDVVINVIETAPLVLPIHHGHPWWSLLMGIEHERVHFETSSVLLRQLPSEFLKRPHNWRYGPLTAPVHTSATSSPIEVANEMIEVEEGEVIMGKPWNFPTYGWDYEYGELKMWVPKFEASKYIITNGEYLVFVKEGGYSRREYWTDEGWEWVQFKQAKHPVFWVCHRKCRSGCGSELAKHSHCTLAPPTHSDPPSDKENYKYRAMFDVLEMPLDWPVEVNYHEAKAYCVWKGPGYRLLTEAENMRIRGEHPPSCEYDCDDPIRVQTDQIKYNNNLAFGSSTPVNYLPSNAYGFHDVYGNVYTWTEDHINGFPGFKTNYLYEDMATSYFDGRHNVILGGSWASCGDTSSRFSRWWFRRHFFQHVGFRLARSLTNEDLPVRLCQADHLYTNSCSKNVAADLTGRNGHHLIQPLNPQFEFDRVSVCEEIVLKTMDTNAESSCSLVSYCKKQLLDRNNPLNRATVFGCGPGYTTFLLTEIFSQVVGVDYGGRLIAIANQFKDEGSITITNKGTFHLPHRNGDNYNTNRAIFKQFTWVPNELEGFDFVLFESLERFNNPKGWLLKLHEVVRPGCMVIVSGSDQWNWQILSDYLMDWFVLIDQVKLCGDCVSAWVKIGKNLSLNPETAESST